MLGTSIVAGGIAQVLEHRCLPIQVDNVLPLENHPTLALPPRAARRKVWVLDDEAEEHTHVDLLRVGTSVRGDITPLADRSLVPSAPRPKP